MKSKGKSRNGRLTPEDWIELTLDEIAKTGVKGIRVNDLCDRMGVTKGSFYTHFASKEDLLQGVLKYWSSKQPEVLSNRAYSLSATGLGMVYEWLNQVRKMDVLRRDAALREWASYDKKVAKVLEKTDRLVLGYIEKILSESDTSIPEGQIPIVARLLFLSALGSISAPWILKGMDLDQFIELLEV